MKGLLGRTAVALVLATTASCALLPNAPAVKNDDADAIRYVDWIDVNELPTGADLSFPLDLAFSDTAVKVLEVSQPDRLFLAVWHNTCPPLIRVSTFITENDGLGLIVEINDSRQRSCGDLLQAWIVDIHPETEIDMDLAFVSHQDNRTR